MARTPRTYRQEWKNTLLHHFLKTPRSTYLGVTGSSKLESIVQWQYRAYPLLYTQRPAIEQQIASCVPDASNDLKRLEDCALDTYQRKRFWIKCIWRGHRRRQNRGRNRDIRRSSRNHYRRIYRWNSRRLFCRENRNFLNKYRN